jgi:hypothetical protein
MTSTVTLASLAAHKVSLGDILESKILDEVEIRPDLNEILLSKFSLTRLYEEGLIGKEIPLEILSKILPQTWLQRRMPIYGTEQYSYITKTLHNVLEYYIEHPGATFSEDGMIFSWEKRDTGYYLYLFTHDTQPSLVKVGAHVTLKSLFQEVTVDPWPGPLVHIRGLAVLVGPNRIKQKKIAKRCPEELEKIWNQLKGEAWSRCWDQEELPNFLQSGENYVCVVGEYLWIAERESCHGMPSPRIMIKKEGVYFLTYYLNGPHEIHPHPSCLAW